MAVYDEIGIRPFINARAPHTRFGGSIMPKHVVDAIAEAARYSVEMDELQSKLGVELVEIGSRNGTQERDLTQALDDSTAAVLTCGWQGLLPVERVTQIAHAAGIPVIVDAAGEVPPIQNFWRYTRDCGADAVVISGGKGLRGPQATGLVLGSREIIDGCVANGNPNRGVGRTMKVSKEDMIGLYVAVRHAVEHHEADMLELQASEALLLERLGNISGIEIEQDPPFLLLSLGHVTGYKSDRRVMSDLRDGEPSILALCRSGTLWINVATLQPGEDAMVADRLVELLS